MRTNRIWKAVFLAVALTVLGACGDEPSDIDEATAPEDGDHPRRTPPSEDGVTVVLPPPKEPLPLPRPGLIGRKPSDTLCGKGEPSTPAVSISVKSVAVYQGVKIPIVEGGRLVHQRNAPIVAGRPGLVRVFVRPERGWKPRDLWVRLTVGDIVKEQRFRPSGPSAETEASSTINFGFETGELPADANFSVELLELTNCAQPPGEFGSPRFPADGSALLHSEKLAATLRVTIVPIQYEADGSGRLPDLSTETIEEFRTALFKAFPVEDVELTVREPVKTTVALARGGSGFGKMLNLCLNTRNADRVAPDEYYYCVIQPTETRRDFCRDGCVAGVAPLASVHDVEARGGIGISFTGGDGAGVFVHEMGHAMGRPHAPCGVRNSTDPDYPHAGGLIGSWGYDIVNGELFDPSRRADFMGYCRPTWTSDYTYERLFERMQLVLGAQSLRSQMAPTQWRTAVVETDGSIAWGSDVTLTHLPSGKAVTAQLDDAEGNAVGELTVYVTPIADIDAFLLALPHVESSAVIIDIPDIGELPL